MEVQILHDNPKENYWELVMKSSELKKSERLVVRGGHTFYSSSARSLFDQLGAMHLVAPYLPGNIHTNFHITPQIRKLMGGMYQSVGHKPPKMSESSHPIGNGNFSFTFPKTDRSRAIVAYSAGKDSLWNLWWAQNRFGEKNVSAVHIRGLNKSQGSQEHKYSVLQSERIGFPLTVVDLLNGCSNAGYQTMRSRDMFMMALMIPHALANKARYIITEGFEEEKPSEPFTGLEKNMTYFDAMLEQLGVPVKVIWRNKPEMAVISDLIKNRPEWLAMVNNCFSPDCYRTFLHKRWLGLDGKPGKAATFPLFDSQCGSCVKCRITNVARILHDPIMESVEREDIRTYLKTTLIWVKDKHEQVADMIEGSFMEALGKACQRYEVS